MKIAFVLGDISSIGGIERVTSILSDTFVKCGHDVTIISLFCAHDQLNYSFNKNVKIEYVSKKKYATKKQGGFSRLFMFFSIVYSFYSYLKNRDFDVFIGQGFPVNWLLWLVGKSKKSIACEHVSYNYYPSVIRKVRILIYKCFRAVVVLTQNDAKRFRKYLNNIYVVPNPVLVHTLKTSELSVKRMISVGRLSYQKGYDLLLSIMPDVFKKFPDWSLDIYGEGDLKDDLLRLRDRLGLQSYVHFRGVTSNIEDEYLKSSLYVMSSRYEGFGMVLVEAAACGLPIISFDCPEGPSDILQGNRGILVPMNDTEKLKKVIIEMLSNSELRSEYAKRSLEISSRYTPEEVYNLWRKVLLL